MLKRAMDVGVATSGLIVLSPVILTALGLVWLQDFKSPLYMGERVGRRGRGFRMAKIRSMVVGADRTGVESTGAADGRITRLGHFIRRFKLDEITQLWNVALGDMSLVGPRPNTLNSVAKYSEEERGLLAVRPGITDFSSIVFSDEGDIIEDAPDPDAAYDALIRPWKSRLGLFYIENRTLWVDVAIIGLTVMAIIDRPAALRRLSKILAALNAPADLQRVARRDAPLQPV